MVSFIENFIKRIKEYREDNSDKIVEQFMSYLCSFFEEKPNRKYQGIEYCTQRYVKYLALLPLELVLLDQSTSNLKKKIDYYETNLSGFDGSQKTKEIYLRIKKFLKSVEELEDTKDMQKSKDEYLYLDVVCGAIENRILAKKSGNQFGNEDFLSIAKKYYPEIIEFNLEELKLKLEDITIKIKEKMDYLDEINEKLKKLKIVNFERQKHLTRLLQLREVSSDVQERKV